MRDDPALLELMLADQRGRSDLHRPGPYWEPYARRISHALRREGMGRFRASSAIGKGYADSVLFDPSTLWDPGNWKQRFKRWIVGFPPLRRMLFEPFVETARARYREHQRFVDAYYSEHYGPWLRRAAGDRGLPDTLAGGCERWAEIDGERIAISYVHALIRIGNMARALDLESATSVFEIGGGFGSHAHLLLHLYPGIRRYLYLDIPPVLYVGTQYLRHQLGEESILDYQATRNLVRIDLDQNGLPRVVAICPWQIDRVQGTIDVFWNSASFQEMPAQVVQAYAIEVDRLLHAQRGRAGLYVYQHGRDDGRLDAERIIAALGSGWRFTYLEPELDEPNRVAQYLVGARAS